MSSVPGVIRPRQNTLLRNCVSSILMMWGPARKVLCSTQHDCWTSGRPCSGAETRWRRQPSDKREIAPCRTQRPKSGFSMPSVVYQEQINCRSPGYVRHCCSTRNSTPLGTGSGRLWRRHAASFSDRAAPISRTLPHLRSRGLWQRPESAYPASLPSWFPKSPPFVRRGSRRLLCGRCHLAQIPGVYLHAGRGADARHHLCQYRQRSAGERAVGLHVQ